MQPFSLNINGRLIEYSQPLVMAIINVTPDSFYSGSRALTIESIAEQAQKAVSQGADILDIGACSTRPNNETVSPEEELRRLELGITTVRQLYPEAVISVDTYRSQAAKIAVAQLGANIVNDISGGRFDDAMFQTVAELSVPYVLTYNDGSVSNAETPNPDADIAPAALRWLGQRISELNLSGVNDIIVDPGFGFNKSLDQNYELLKHLEVFETLGTPLLVGISRKSMITKLLDIAADDSLCATTAVHLYALLHGASMLRVHDAAPAKQAIKLYQKLQ